VEPHRVGFENRRDLGEFLREAGNIMATANGISPSAAGLSGPVPHGSWAKLNNG
jgi:hypothetical protein